MRVAVGVGGSKPVAKQVALDPDIFAQKSQLSQAMRQIFDAIEKINTAAGDLVGREVAVMAHQKDAAFGSLNFSHMIAIPGYADLGRHPQGIQMLQQSYTSIFRKVEEYSQKGGAPIKNCASSLLYKSWWNREEAGCL